MPSAKSKRNGHVRELRPACGENRVSGTKTVSGMKQWPRSAQRSPFAASDGLFDQRQQLRELQQEAGDRLIADRAHLDGREQTPRSYRGTVSIMR